MQDPIRKIFLAFIQLHILHHAKKEPIYGSWMIEELKHHGYDISAGTLYPIFHNLEKADLIISEKRNINGKIRKYYSITEKGENTLLQAKDKIDELKFEITT
ncbi:MAG: PadR family transcriptional regulator [Pleomorphochaeta sp.]